MITTPEPLGTVLYEILGYILRLYNGLNGFNLVYLHRIGDFRGDTRTLRLLRKTSELAVPLGLIDETENKLKILWLSLPGDYRVTDEALLAETT